MSAVYGNDTVPLIISAPGGVWSSMIAPGWSPPVENPGVSVFFPCYPYDSYAAGNALWEDELLTPTVSQFFEENTLGEHAELNVNSPTGASWSPSVANSFPDENNRWLVMQLTSRAHVEGVLNFQILPLGISADVIQVTRPFNTAPLCVDPYACNYESGGFEDQGLCDYSCCPGPGCCGIGTTWDSVSQTCLPTHLHDADFDGCVGMADLLDLLSVFGTCFED